MSSAARQTGSPSTSRLRAAGQGRMCRCAIAHRPWPYCALKRHIKSEGLQRVQSEPGSEYTTLRGRPTESKLKVALSGIADSSWVATDNHAGYACILSLLGVVKHTSSVVKESRDSEKRPCQCDAAKAQASSYFPSMGCRRNGCSACLACLLWTKQARHSKQDSKAMLSGTAHRRQLCTHEARLSTCPSLSGTSGRQGLGPMVVLQREVFLEGRIPTPSATGKYELAVQARPMMVLAKTCIHCRHHRRLQPS